MSVLKLGKGLLAVTLSSFLFACASSDKNTSDDMNQSMTDSTSVTEVTPPAKTPEQLQEEANAATRQERVVYFDLDDDTVKPAGRELLEAHAWFLAKNPGMVITVDGHCDERGTPAYNLALGERRAKAVAQILMLNGVAESQIKTRSFGEEKPAMMGHDESSWSKNRRGELSYQG